MAWSHPCTRRAVLLQRIWLSLPSILLASAVLGIAWGLWW